MFMPMMDIGIVRMFVAHADVTMAVGVRLLRTLARLVFVLVMFVMSVFMFVVFGQVQVDAGGRAQSRADEAGADGFVEEQQREAGAREGAEREISAGAGRAQVAQSGDEGGQAESVAESSDECGGRQHLGRGPLSLAKHPGQQQVAAAGAGF